MIHALVEKSVRFRGVVLVLTLFFLFAGIFAFKRLPIEAYPDVTNVSFKIITLFPGHAAEEVERLVTIPVENEMNGIPQRSSIRSISMFGLSVVTLVFEDDADNKYVRNQAVQHLTNVNLPSDAQSGLSPDSTPIGEIYRYTLKAPKDFPLVELKALEDWVVERQFRTVPGVVDVNGFGGPTKQYQVLVDPAKLKSYGLTLSQVFTALSNANRNAGGSYIEHGQEMYIVRGLGFIQSLEDIASIGVDTRRGTPIRIRDIGTVQIGERLRLGRVGMTTHLGVDVDDAVEGIVILRKGANALDVLKDVEKKAEEINRNYLPPGVRLVMYYNRTELIYRTLRTVLHNMIEGILLVLLVLILFLGLENYRSALVVAIVAPLSLLGAFTLLDLQGIPANLISMGAIDFGIIVDSAVVVIENTLRLLEENPRRKQILPGIIIRSVSQMGKPILFAKAILITAFIPLYTLQQVEGRIFRPMALTLTFTLVSGTILAITLVPALASFALKGKIATHESWVVRLLHRIYHPLLGAAIRFRYVFLAFAMMLLVIAGLILSNLGTEFLPKLDEGSIWIRCFMPETIAPSEATQLVQKARSSLVSFPEVKTVVSQLGRPDDGTDINGFNVAEMAVELKPREEWKTAKNREDLCDSMKKKLDAILGLESQFSQNIEDNVNEAVSGIKGELGIKIYGQDPNKLQELSDKIAGLISKVPGAVDVSAEELLGQPQVQITIDRSAIARAGIAVNDVQSIVETALGGVIASKILEGERTFDLVVKINPGLVSNLESIKKIPVFGSNNEKLTLDQIATVNIGNGFAKIYREQNARLTDVKFSVRGRDLGSVVKEAERKVRATIKLPINYRLAWTGSFENQQRAVARLKVVAPITVVLIYFLLYSAFNSNRCAILIILNAPFVFVGGIFALPLAGLNLSVSALVGFMALFGISLLNRVILVERIYELRYRGIALDRAILQGAISRIRPVVMTALMAMFGLLPAALSKGVGAETSRPFAVVIIGGLLAEILITPFIVPILFPWFEKKQSSTEESHEHDFDREIDPADGTVNPPNPLTE